MVDFNIRVVVDPTQATAGARQVDRELKRVDGTASRLGATFARVFAAAGLSIGIAGSIRLLADFSQQMSTVAAVTQATGAEFAALNEEAQRLGIETRFTASQAAEGMVLLSRAGFTAGETLKATNQVLLLAQAGNLGLAEAADIAANAMRGFRLPVEEAGRVTDVLALAANSANTDVSQLGQGLKFVAPIAAGVGVELEETAAAMSALSNAGLQASLAGTGLRRVISELESPTANSAKILASYGLTTEQVRVSQVGLTQALKTLADAGVDTGAALEIFGDRGGPAFEVLSNSIPFVEQLTERLEGAGGTAERIARIMDDNLNGALLRVRSAFEGLVLAIGEGGANSALRNLAEGLANVLRSLVENVEDVIRVGEALGALFATRLGIHLVVAAFNALKVALLSNPITLLPTILAAGIAAVVAFREEIADFEIAGVRLGDALQAAFNVARDRFNFLVERVAEFIPVVREVAASTIDAFRVAFDGVLGFFGQFIDAFAPAFDGLFGEQGATGAVRKFANFSIAVLKTVGDAFQAVIEAVTTAFANLATFDITSPLESLKRITSQTFADIGDTINNTLRTSQQNFRTDYVGAFTDIGNAAATNLLSGFKGLEGAAAIAEFLDFTGSFEEELAKVEGERVAAEFIAGAKSILEKARGFFQQIFPQQPEATPTPTATEPAAPGLSPQALELYQQINEPAQQYAQTLAALNELQAANKISAEEYAFALNEATIAANVASSSMTSGLSAGLAQVRNQLMDVSGAVQQTVVNAFNRAEDAIVQFATTGEVNFSAFVDGLLADVARILARKALLALIEAFAGGAGGGGGIFGAVVSAFSNSGGAGQEAEGGLVQADRPRVVGEFGPELFTPRDEGRITPAGETAAALQNGGRAPEVNVTTPPPTVNVINVADPSEIPQGIESDQGEQAIMNVIRRNARTVKSFTG